MRARPTLLAAPEKRTSTVLPAPTVTRCSAGLVSVNTAGSSDFMVTVAVPPAGN